MFHCTCIVKLLGLPFQQAGARHAVLLPLTLPSLLLFFLKPLGMCVCLIAQDSQFFDEVYCACIVSVLGVCRAGKGVSSSSSCSIYLLYVYIHIHIHIYTYIYKISYVILSIYIYVINSLSMLYVSRCVCIDLV